MANKKNGLTNKAVWVLILIPYLLIIPAFFWYQHLLNQIKNSSFIIVSKEEMILYHYDFKGDLLQKSQIACGKSPGNKEKTGDNKTPEGVFTIGNVKKASTWSHDFKDDSLGEIKGAYGPYFISLNVPNQKGIGIHGTHDNNSIGTRASEGCIRMHNEDINQLVKNIQPSTVVVITPGSEDVVLDNLKFSNANNIKIKVAPPINHSKKVTTSSNELDNKKKDLDKDATRKKISQTNSNEVKNKSTKIYEKSKPHIIINKANNNNIVDKHEKNKVDKRNSAKSKASRKQVRHNHENEN